MENRRHFLTASDVKDLLPFTKSGRKRTVTEDDYVSIALRKLALVSDDDLVSTGAAARGHILEPYAIRHYNENYMAPGMVDLYHWDDVVVVNHKISPVGFLETLEVNGTKFEFGGLAFSPDACDIEMDERSRNTCMTHASNPNVIGEVKCYGNDRHVASMMKSVVPAELEERWQIATAMATKYSINDAYLIFFNPDMPMASMCVVEYSRCDLLKEIEEVLKVEEEWKNVIKKICDYPEHYFHEGVCFCPDTLSNDIRETYKNSIALNP